MLRRAGDKSSDGDGAFDQQNRYVFPYGVKMFSAAADKTPLDLLGNRLSRPVNKSSEFNKFVKPHDNSPTSLFERFSGLRTHENFK